MFSRALHRPRQWRNTIAILFVLFVSLIGLLSAWCREYCLRAIPDIPEPFDFDAVAYVEVLTDENAFELYRLAADRLRPLPDSLKGQYWDFFHTDWSDLPEPWRQWLADNHDVLEIYRRGSDRTRAVYIQPGEQIPTTQLTVSQNLAYLGLLAVFEARRLAADGECSVAWDWHRAVLRSSRHSGRNGGVIERLVGCTIYGRELKPIIQWSSLPDVDAEMLRRALRDVREIDQMTVPTSDSIKAEYLEHCKVLSDPVLFDQMFGEKRYLQPSTLRRLAWPIGEPQTTRRLAKLVNRNWLSQCDLPRESRTPIYTSQGMLFAPDPTAGPLTAEATNEQLEKWIRCALFRQLTMACIPQFLDTVDLDAARRRLLDAALNIQLYHREQGAYPEGIERLLGNECDALPVDPFGTGEPLRYRRETNPDEGVTLWSIGLDGVDNDGTPISVSGDFQGDLVLNIKPPHYTTVD